METVNSELTKMIAESETHIKHLIEMHNNLLQEIQQKQNTLQQLHDEILTANGVYQGLLRANSVKYEHSNNGRISDETIYDFDGNVLARAK